MPSSWGTFLSMNIFNNNVSCSPKEKKEGKRKREKK